MGRGEKWEKICTSFEESHCGYESYDREDLGDWGVSLISLAHALSLGRNHPDASFVLAASGGWANLQDVLIWKKLAS